MRLQVLELFAGTRSIGKAFERRGHIVTSVEIDPKFPDCIHADAYSFLQDHGDEYDVIWASPCCTTYSIAGIRLHRLPDENGKWLIPKNDYAMQCDTNNRWMFNWFNEHRNMLWFIENPRGNMANMPFAQCLSDLKGCLCYCQYGVPTMKPTNIWTTHPNPKWRPMCRPGADHHPKGSRYAFENIARGCRRSVIPEELCDHVAEITEEYFEGKIL